MSAHSANPLKHALVAAALAAGGALVGAAPAAASAPAVSPPAASAHYDHIFVIVEENHGYSDVIGNPAAPNLNALAAQYGVATNYFAVAHPSEPNYVALLGGSPFDVTTDNAYYVNRVAAPSLISQLDHAGVGWKAYLQSLPHAGYQGICYPANCNGAPDKDPLYVSKHNAIANFTTSLDAADWSRQVPIGQLSDDLRSGDVPAFDYVIPDECHDQHGDPPFCLDSGSTGGGDPQDQRLVAVGDRYLGSLVAQITGASFWAEGNNAIDVVYDEGDDDANGGGQVANVVVTSHGPRGLKDPALYSHYSLLQTVQRNFGLGCLQNTCDTATVKPISPLLAVTGAPAAAFRPLTVPSIATPTPTPDEPVSAVADTPSSAGWTVQPAPMLGTGDNTYGAVAAVSPKDVWAVGNYLPDLATANVDATLSTAAHFDGTRWTWTPTVNFGPNFTTLFGVAAVPGRAWAVGDALDSSYQAHSVIEAWDGTAWKPARTPRLDTERDLLFSAAAVSADDVWAVGGRQSEHDDRFSTLIEHWDGTHWSVVPSPGPGSAGGTLYGVAASGPHDVWAVGQRDDAGSDLPLVEHWDGKRWSVVDVPAAGATGALLQGVTVADGQVWAVGQTDDSVHQARPLIEHLSGGVWHAQIASTLGAGFSDVTGVAVSGGTVWLAGSYFDDAGGNELTLVARNDGAGWRQVAAPNPGTGDKVLGGMAAAGGEVWTAGFDKTDIGRSPLIELHSGR
jgi:hypothetical protein